MPDLFADDDDVVVDQTKNYLEDLVGEGKKFKTPEDLARGKFESDAFIARLQNEMKGLRSELSTRLKLEEVVDKITASKSESLSNDGNQSREPDVYDKDKSALSPDDVRELISKQLTDSEKQAQRARNTAFVEQKCQEAFGPTFRRTLKDRAAALNVGEQFLKDMAADQPKAFLTLMDVREQREVNSTATTAPRTSVNTNALGFQPDAGVKRKSHYDAIRVKEPRRYWSVSVQQEMHSEAQKQGPSFFEG
jgi:hypothetical protein